MRDTVTYYTQAVSLYRRALAAKEESLGPSHPSTLRTVNNLAVLLRQRGEMAEARVCMMSS